MADAFHQIIISVSFTTLQISTKNNADVKFPRSIDGNADVKFSRSIDGNADVKFPRSIEYKYARVMSGSDKIQSRMIRKISFRS